jgi:LacI family transcriptional regulator
MARLRQRIRHVALLVEWSRVYGRGVLRGIGRYVQAHGNWKVYHTERRLSDMAPSWLRNWKGDGIIARIENPRLAAQIKRMRLPVVDLFEHSRIGRVPSVLTDNRAIARLAAEHLIERGLTHFAYCGLPGIYSSDERCRCFVRHLASAGHQVRVYDPPRRRRTPLIAASEDYELQREETLVRWLRGLPKPVGLMACNDLRAHQILMVCDENHLAVPEELAVIGVDNDEVICGLSRPPLSSIEQNPEEVGYQAAALLDRLMQGPCSRHTRCAADRATIVVEPRGVVARQSTDVVAVPDADLAIALHHIRQHACDGLSVAALLARTAMSRRTLERRFASHLGRSPKDEIVRVQLGHVKRLLAMTDYPLAKIAQFTGFRYVESMCALFKRSVGRTPGQYRRDIRSEVNRWV